MIYVTFFLLIVIAVILGAVQAIKADKIWLGSYPNSLPYAWGYLWGYVHLYVSIILLSPIFFSLLTYDSIHKMANELFFFFGEGHFATKLLFRVLFIVTGLGILKQKRWFWVMNLFLWAIIAFKGAYKVGCIDVRKYHYGEDHALHNLSIIWIFHGFLLILLNIIYVVKRWKQMSVYEKI